MHRRVSPPPLYTHARTHTHTLPNLRLCKYPKPSENVFQATSLPHGPPGCLIWPLGANTVLSPLSHSHCPHLWLFWPVRVCVLCPGQPRVGGQPRLTCSQCHRALGKHVCPVSPAQKDSKVGRAAADTQEESCLTVLLAVPILKDMPIRYP